MPTTPRGERPMTARPAKCVSSFATYQFGGHWRRVEPFDVRLRPQRLDHQCHENSRFKAVRSLHPFTNSGPHATRLYHQDGCPEANDQWNPGLPSACRRSPPISSEAIEGRCTNITQPPGRSDRTTREPTYAMLSQSGRCTYQPFGANCKLGNPGIERPEANDHDGSISHIEPVVRHP